MNGVLVINKPKGITSHDVVSRVRRILHTKKVGHAGTLDPLATGVLIVLVGKATKLSDMLLCEEKRYIASFELGYETDTLDVTGEVTARYESSVEYEEVNKAVSSFLGKQLQVPPMYSAIKKDGKKLYELARNGETVERPPREIEIFDIKLSGNSIDVCCSKGTYIRSLIFDIGRKLGCGATLTELKRTKSGRFSLENSVTLEELEEKGFEACALTIDEIIDAQTLTVSGNDEKRVKNGNLLFKEGFFGGCKIYGEDGALLCYALGDGEKLKPDLMFYEDKLC